VSRTPIPAKITFAGGKTWKISMRHTVQSNSHPMTYQTNAFPECLRERIQDIHGWIEPVCQPLVAAPRTIEVLDLLLKHGENGGWRIAGLELGGEWMGEKIFLCLFFVRFQGIIENELEVGGRGGRGVSTRHEGGSGRSVEKMMDCVVSWAIGLRVNRYPGVIGLPHVCSDIPRKVSDLDMLDRRWWFVHCYEE